MTGSNEELHTPQWAFILTCIPFGTPVVLYICVLVSDIVLNISRGSSGMWSGFSYEDGLYVIFSSVFFILLLIRWRRFCSQTRRKRILAAIASWLLIILVFTCWIIFDYFHAVSWFILNT
jgi:hypothetical protein